MMTGRCPIHEHPTQDFARSGAGDTIGVTLGSQAKTFRRVQ